MVPIEVGYGCGHSGSVGSRMPVCDRHGRLETWPDGWELDLLGVIEAAGCPVCGYRASDGGQEMSGLPN